MAKQTEREKLIKGAKVLRNKLAADRDALRDLLADLRDIEEEASEAVGCLDDAIDAMSQSL